MYAAKRIMKDLEPGRYIDESAGANNLDLRIVTFACEFGFVLNAEDKRIVNLFVDDSWSYDDDEAMRDIADDAVDYLDSLLDEASTLSWIIDDNSLFLVEPDGSPAFNTPIG